MWKKKVAIIFVSDIILYKFKYFHVWAKLYVHVEALVYRIWRNHEKLEIL